MDDRVAETENISLGPMTSRLLSTMRFERRPEEKEKANGVLNIDAMDISIPESADPNAEPTNDDHPPATLFAESTNPNWKASTAKHDYSQMDERLKQELRYIGFLGQEDEPDYDAHYDDEIAQRLRFLQSELRTQMVINGARKSRLEALAKEVMAWQEYATINDDLDSQVNQAFSKRNRLTGKGKKNVKRPSAAGGLSNVGGSGVARPGIGEMARTLMDRRRRWKTTVEPVFGEDLSHVRNPEDSVFHERDMELYMVEEKEKLEEELAAS